MKQLREKLDKKPDLPDDLMAAHVLKIQEEITSLKKQLVEAMKKNLK